MKQKSVKSNLCLPAKPKKSNKKAESLSALFQRLSPLFECDRCLRFGKQFFSLSQERNTRIGVGGVFLISLERKHLRLSSLSLSLSTKKRKN